MSSDKSKLSSAADQFADRLAFRRAGCVKAQKFYTIEQIADCLVVSTRTVRRWIKSGALPVHRINGVVRASEADFAAFLAARRDA